MEKQAKNIITREKIEKDLLSQNIASLRHTAFCFFAAALACGGSSAVFLGIFLPTEFVWLNIIIWAFFLGVVCAPAWIMLPRFIKDLIERKHLKNGDVEIVTLPLLYETEETRYTRKTRMEYTQHKFHFEGFDAFLASPEQSKRFTRGDECYIVYYKGTQKVRSMFSLKFYEYKEDEE